MSGDADAPGNQAPVRRASWRLGLCIAVAGALAGAGITYRLASAATSDAVTFSPASLAADAPLALDAWLAKVASFGGQPPEAALRHQLVRSLVASPALRADVLRHLGREARRPVRAAMREMLAATRAVELGDQALELARSDEPLARAAGFELAATLPPAAAVYELARRGVANETDATALAGALIALRPPTLLSQAEIGAALPRLVALTRHPDALVRAHATQRVAEWDRIGDQALPLVRQALEDSELIVRQAAIGAVMIGQLRSSSLQQALVTLCGDGAEPAVARSAALAALERFPLTDAELAIYQRARADLERAR